MEISALDETGNLVDWWFIYKVPKLGAGAGIDSATGYEYVYYDSKIDVDPDRTKRIVTKSPNILNSNDGALNLTLNSVFNVTPQAPSTGWILYNDEMPEKVGKRDDGNKGHKRCYRF